MNQSPRTRARELVLQTLYACEHGESEPDETFDDISGEYELSENIAEFARNLLHLVISNAEKAKMAEIVSGLENLMRFDVVEGNLIKDYGKISAQQIIPQMMYKITQEGVSVDKAMSCA